VGEHEQKTLSLFYDNDFLSDESQQIQLSLVSELFFGLAISRACPYSL